MGQLKKKLHHQNPHVSFYALQVLESVVKNCGSPLHEEVSALIFYFIFIFFFEKNMKNEQLIHEDENEVRESTINNITLDTQT